jgi:hypothetical protein
MMKRELNMTLNGVLKFTKVHATHKSVKPFFYLHSIGKHNKKDIISHICRLISIVP